MSLSKKGLNRHLELKVKRNREGRQKLVCWTKIEEEKTKIFQKRHVEPGAEDDAKLE